MLGDRLNPFNRINAHNNALHPSPPCIRFEIESFTRGPVNAVVRPLGGTALFLHENV
jgi:hypothetical protein